MATDSGYVTVVLGSGATSGVTPGTRDDNLNGDYVTTLANTMILPGKWEACLVTASFAKMAMPAPESVFILMDILDNSTIGPQEQPLLFLTHPIQPSDPDPVSIQHTTTISQWKKISGSVISRIRIQIFSTSGLYPPTPTPPTPNVLASTVQFVIRQVSD